MIADNETIAVRRAPRRLLLFAIFGFVVASALSGLVAVAGGLVWLVASFWPEEQAPRPTPLFSIVDVSIPDAVIALSYSPDGKYIAAGSRYYRGTPSTWEGDLFIWETATGKEHFRKHFSQWVPSIAFHPNGKYLAVTSSSHNLSRDGYLDFVQQQGEVHLFEFPAMRSVKVLKFNVLAGDVRFSADGKSLVVLSCPQARVFGPCEVNVFDFPSLERRVVLSDVEAKAPILPPIAVSPDGKRIFAVQHHHANGVGKLAVLNVDTGKREGFAKNFHPNYSGCLEITKDGTLVSAGQALRYYDSRNEAAPKGLGSILNFRSGAKGMIKWASLASDNKRLLAIDQKGARGPFTSKVVIEDFDKNELVTVFEEKEVIFNRCCWAPDGKSFAVGTAGYRGIHGNQGGRLSGHVLIFRPKDQ